MMTMVSIFERSAEMADELTARTATNGAREQCDKNFDIVRFITSEPRRRVGILASKHKRLCLVRKALEHTRLVSESIVSRSLIENQLPPIAIWTRWQLRVNRDGGGRARTPLRFRITPTPDVNSAR